MTSVLWYFSGMASGNQNTPAGLSVSAPAAQTVNDGHARDYNPAAVIYGGAYSKAELDKIAFTDNRDGFGHTDLQQIYAAAGITQADFDSSDTVVGTVYKTGDIAVFGRLVAVSSETDSRNLLLASAPFNWLPRAPNAQLFIATSIPAWVDMKGGSFHWAILMSCGCIVTQPIWPSLA
ncbi:hypothetical protein HJC99_04380 [Candidatus Saccharibacteria bacterium]|nr:hypothetical protein [Candidatus Saccharibacteria bacterium]